tara:strand:+ start:216 stop:956 length:741 start_codon:yes stop_codon:yes gene_type:complete
MPDLCVNIDHVATLRNARRGIIPDPVKAAKDVEAAGAAGVTVHLREDRRHIRDIDLPNIKNSISIRFNLELAPTDEMCEIAIKTRPSLCMFVPEKREEITTEGGLNIIKNKKLISIQLKKIQKENLKVSAFIEPDPLQAKAAIELGFDACELHTGNWANSFSDTSPDSSKSREALYKILETAKVISKSGCLLNAGHGLDTSNVAPIAAIKGLNELHIGHSLVSDAIFLGLKKAIKNMIATIEKNSS